MMFGHNIDKPLLEYGHSYGSNANPELSSNIHKNCGAGARIQAQKMKDRLQLTLQFLKKKQLIAICLDLGLSTEGSKQKLRHRLLPLDN